MILIAEDNDTSAKLLELALQKEQYETLRAENGRDALEKLSAHPETRLLISDIMMPEMDGLQLLTELRQRPEYAQLPVIMCTSLADAGRVKEAAQLGCHSYVVKPVRPAELLKRVKEALAAESPVIKPAEEIRTELGLDDEALGEIAADFQRQLTELSERLAAAGDAPDAALARELHGLVESATVFGAQGLIKRLQTLASGDAQAMEALKRQAPALLEELRATAEGLETLRSQGS